MTTTYLQSVSLLGDDELREEVRRQYLQFRTLHGRESQRAKDRCLQLMDYLRESGKRRLFDEGVAAVDTERARLAASNVAGRMGGLRRAE